MVSLICREESVRLLDAMEEDGGEVQEDQVEEEEDEAHAASCAATQLQRTGCGGCGEGGGVGEGGGDDALGGKRRGGTARDEDEEEEEREAGEGVDTTDPFLGRRGHALVGTKVKGLFFSDLDGCDQWFDGEISLYYSRNGWYRITYEDGDEVC